MTAPKQRPVLVTDVAREVKAVGGSIWLLEKPPYGFLLRCELGTKQFRVVIRPLSGETPAEIPHEKSPLHIVSAVFDLRDWLQSLSA